MLRVQLYGPLAIKDHQDVDRRPSLLKSRALLAVLATIPGHCHTRSWFQNLLWEDRPHAQGRASLRAALSDIRRHLGPFAYVLQSTKDEIALNPVGFTCLPPIDGQQTLLDGFDVPHASNFEDWLREARNRKGVFRDSASATPNETATKLIEPPALFLANAVQGPATLLRMQVDTLVDGIAKSLTDCGLVRIEDGRGAYFDRETPLDRADQEGCDYLFETECAETSAGSIFRLKLVRTSDRQLLWTKSHIAGATFDLFGATSMGFVAEFVDFLSDLVVKHDFPTTDIQSPALLAAIAMSRVFVFDTPHFADAERMLEQAYEAEPNGRYLAWRAYLKTAQLAEQCFDDRASLIEEGISLARRALEQERHNSVVLALCAQTEIILTGRFGVAREFAAQALNLNRFNPLAWSLLGAASAFVGDHERGYAQAQVGARLARGTEISFKLESYASATGIMAGDYVGARCHAEVARARAPGFAPPLRYLSALYTATGEADLAQETVDALREREPDFTLHRLKDSDYPSDSIRQSDLLAALPSRHF